MAFGSFFAPKQQQPQQQQQQPNQGNAGQGGNPQNGNDPSKGNGNPHDPNAGNTGVQPPANPLDVFSKMWDTDPNKKEDVAPSFTLDDETLGKVSSAQDFMKGINPELMQKATGGDAASMIEMMHHVGRNAYKAALSHGSTLTDKFVGAREAYNEKGLSGKVKGELVNNELAQIPNSSHPAVKKQIMMVAEQFQRQHPDASPSEIRAKTVEYFKVFTDAINTNPNDKANQTPREI
jgi:hypothetical protein